MTDRYRSGCLLCGQPLVYLPAEAEQTCLYCGNQFSSNARCQEGHFVCDACHGAGANDLIEQYCRSSTETNPQAMAEILMRHPALAMHGPEHHFLVPAVLVTAYHNLVGAEPELREKRLKQARKRAEQVPGGACGTCGSCGAGVGSGIFISLITRATPLSGREWQLSNQVTAESLLLIAQHGGPRCCKRNTRLAIQQAQRFSARELGVGWPEAPAEACAFSALNKECRQEACLFHPHGVDTPA